MSAYEIYAPEDDEAAFAAVYRAHSEKLLRYCQYRLRDRHEAEDVVQEAFARAWRTMPVTGPDGSFYPWLRVVAGNLCTDILRKRARSQPVAVIELGSVDGEMDHITEESDRVLVRQALGRLNDRHRSALMMREDEGLTYDQIAQRTGATAGTVESLLWRARQALRREFTVLAGGEGCLAVVGLVAVLAGRTREAGRRAWARILRRLAAFHSGGDTSAAHVAVAAVTALTVASGLAATLVVGSGHHSHTTVVQGSVQPASKTVPAPAGAATPATPVVMAPAAPAAPASTTVGNTTLPSAASLPWATPSSAATTRTRLRVINPVAVGPSAAAAARNSQTTLQVGGLTVGASPAAAGTYVGSVAQRVTTPVTIINKALRR